MKNGKNRFFEDLEVWQYCRQLRIDLMELTIGFPPDEKYRLTDQEIRAARSVTNTLAEGYGRFFYRDSIHFYRQSRGSLYELVDHLIIACDNGYISNDSLSIYKERCYSAIKLVIGYIRYLKKKSGSSATSK